MLRQPQPMPRLLPRLGNQAERAARRRRGGGGAGLNGRQPHCNRVLASVFPVDQIQPRAKRSCASRGRPSCVRRSAVSSAVTHARRLNRSGEEPMEPRPFQAAAETALRRCVQGRRGGTSPSCIGCLSNKSEMQRRRPGRERAPSVKHCKSAEFEERTRSWGSGRASGAVRCDGRLRREQGARVGATCGWLLRWISLVEGETSCGRPRFPTGALGLLRGRPEALGGEEHPTPRGRFESKGVGSRGRSPQAEAEVGGGGRSVAYLVDCVMESDRITTNWMASTSAQRRLLTQVPSAFSGAELLCRRRGRCASFLFVCSGLPLFVLRFCNICLLVSPPVLPHGCGQQQHELNTLLL